MNTKQTEKTQSDELVKLQNVVISSLLSTKYPLLSLPVPNLKTLKNGLRTVQLPHRQHLEPRQKLRSAALLERSLLNIRALAVHKNPNHRPQRRPRRTAKPFR
jgi:hypothetical protein